MAKPTNLDLVHILEKKMGSDPAFLHKLRDDPAKTLESAGLDVTDEIRDAIGKIDWNKPLDDLGKQLETRTTKSMVLDVTTLNLGGTESSGGTVGVHGGGEYTSPLAVDAHSGSTST